MSPESSSAALPHYIQAWLAAARASLDGVDPAAIEAGVEALEAVRARQGTVWICGNGGSAATASHLANDLMAISAPPRLRVACLCDNAAVLTARGNDDGFTEVFARQLDGRIASQDLLVALSVSGRSPNLLRALDCAEAVGAPVLALCGFPGSPLERRASVALRVPGAPGAFGPVEGVHALLCHLLANRLAGVEP